MRMNKSDIKIFVATHTVDIAIVDNPLYVYVLGGASMHENEKIKMIGDNTGDNISEKNRRFNELTVQYWAWKNVKAEYYGLCHYRRFLSFRDEYIECNQSQKFAVEPYISKSKLKKYNLLNAKKMRKEIKKYDVITSIDIPVEGLPFYPRPKKEYEVWKYHPEYLIGLEEMTLLMNTIYDKFPMYYETALEFMELKVHKGFNCYILKKDLFYQMCEFEFGVLFEIANKLDYSKYAGKSERTIGYLGEILYSIFMFWLKKQNKYKIKESQILFFQNTEKKERLYYMLLKEKIKNIIARLSPSYRVSLRLEEQIKTLQADINKIKADINVVKTKEDIKFWLGEPKFEKNLDEVKKNFWASFPKAEGDLRLVQKGNTLLIERLKQICDKINIKFWLHGGSLVGAVRHNGFVPWDDDIDIGMMRNDFAKLKEYLNNNNYYEIAENYYTSLTSRSYRFMRKDLKSNFFVDIFLYDNYEIDSEDVLEEWKMIRTFKKGIQNQWIAKLRSLDIKVFNNIRLDDNPELKTFIDKLLNRYIERFSKNKGDYLLWSIENNYENESRYAWHHGRIFKNEDIFPLKECEFEGKVYNIPANYEKYIFAEYGIGYLEMPNTIGISAHMKQYFNNVNIEEIYNELVETEKQIKIFE